MKSLQLLNGRTMGPDAAPAEARLLFDSYGTSALRILSTFAFTFAVASAFLAGLLLDGQIAAGHLVSRPERLVWASGLMFTFTGFFAAVWAYERRMVARLVLQKDGRELCLTTPTLFGMREQCVAVRDILSTDFHEGDTAGEEFTAPPWLYVRVRGRAAFVMALDGVIPNRRQLFAVLKLPSGPVDAVAPPGSGPLSSSA